MGGKVFLVGAGPGDPGLLTRRGEELLREAEVVVHDHLAAPELLRLAPPGARLVYAGKTASRHSMAQNDINRLLVSEAKAGRTVVRLKGGDPYVFGRGGEEALELSREGVPFEVVPGVSSTVAAAACAGIPVTHRGLSSQVAFLTGHEDPKKAGPGHDWAALARMGTLVCVMGAARLGQVCRELVGHGKDPATPAAMIQWGATPRQRVVAAPLSELSERAREAGLGPPALLVVGPVVTLRDSLDWFGGRPLFGKRVLVTRASDQASRLSKALGELGAWAIERPLLRIEPISPNPALEGALAGLSGYRYLFLTSPNGARIFMDALLASGRDARALAGLRVAVMGPGTAKALAAYGVRADIVPGSYVAEALLSRLAGEPRGPALLARAREAREALPRGLAALGFPCETVPLYDTVALGPQEGDRGMLSDPPDLCCLASASAARGLAGIVPGPERGRFPCASIGPVTGAEARGLGFPVVAEAAESTIPGLALAALAYLAPGGGGQPKGGGPCP
jgi:uroporphyrinogen III methyltransferase/synthase